MSDLAPRLWKLELRVDGTWNWSEKLVFEFRLETLPWSKTMVLTVF